MLGVDYKAKIEVVSLQDSQVRLQLFGPGGEFTPRIPILSPGQSNNLPIHMSTAFNKVTIKHLKVIPPNGEIQGTVLLEAMFSFSESGVGNFRFTGSAGTWFSDGNMTGE